MLWKVKLVGSFKIKDYFLCILSATSLILSFPNFSAEGGSAYGGNVWPLAWFGFVPLFFAIRNKSKIKAFLLSYFTGAVFWFGTIYWLIHVTLPGMIILVLYLALYFGIFGLIFSSLIPHPSSLIKLLFICAVWVLLEYIRSHLFTGFPWALLGYSQYLNLPVIQIADITGAWGVSFLVMMANVAIWQLLSEARIRNTFIPALCFLLAICYGYLKLSHLSSLVPHPSLKISVIQGNIPQERKWDPAAKDFIIEKYIALTKEAAKDKPNLIIWPEASLPVVLEEEPLYFERAKETAQETGIPLLLGAVNNAGGDIYYNSALLISKEGQTITKYDKLHLVPFGEYIPLRKTLRFLEKVVPIGDFTSGKEYTIFSAHSILNTQYSIPFSVLICFEDIFPELSRQFVKKGAGFLVNITNDAWFKKTSSPYQHFSASVLRAVENRCFLVRAANTGVSGFIHPSGKIASLVKDRAGKNIFIDGYLTDKIPGTARNFTIYTQYGDFFIGICFLFALYGIIQSFEKKR